VESELPAQDPAHSIPDLGVIDVNVVRRSGGSDLFIVVASPLAGDEYSLSRLLRKIEAYLEFTNSSEFIEESGLPSPENTRIVVKLHPESSPLAAELVLRNVAWALNNGVTLAVEPLVEHLPVQ